MVNIPYMDAMGSYRVIHESTVTSVTLTAFVGNLWWDEGVITYNKKRTPQVVAICTINQMSHEKNTPTFHCTGWLIGILIKVDYNRYITG